MLLIPDSFCYDRATGEFIGRAVCTVTSLAGLAVRIRSGKKGYAIETLTDRIPQSLYVVAPITKQPRKGR